jgi:hypothetical protein
VGPFCRTTLRADCNGCGHLVKTLRHGRVKHWSIVSILLQGPPLRTLAGVGDARPPAGHACLIARLRHGRPMIECALYPYKFLTGLDVCFSFLCY